MPRRPRSDLADFPLHLIQRGNNRSDCFLTDSDRIAYLHWLGRDAARFGVAIHAWVLMSNHVHLLVSPPTPAQASHLMQSLGRRYVRHFNDAHGRSGTLWEGRFRACAVHADDYLFACMRYIELNPVRAGMAETPGAFRWSSHCRNALGLADPMVVEHPLYTSLGSSPTERQQAYRAQFPMQLDEATLAFIRSATASGHLIASEGRRREVESTRGILLGPAPIGRPRKPKPEGPENEHLNLG
jgi:putative transposase